MSGRLTVTVPAGAAGRRADRVVADASGLSRSFVQRLIEEGRLTRDGAVIKSNTPVEPGTRLELEVPPPRPLDVEPDDIPLDVAHEDDDVLVVNKPAGMVTHPAPGHSRRTLVNALVARGGAAAYGAIAGINRPGIVHRLDRDTSGLILVARNDRAQRWLMAQLKLRRIKKTYVALVAGAPVAEIGRIEAPIGRDARHRTRMAVVADGRPATTVYRVRERLGEWTLLELDLITGRTHQLRVHLSSIGHPIAGDAIYASGAARRGPAGLSRLFLHSWRVEFPAAGADRLVRAEAPLPAELESVLSQLRGRQRE
ncbi:MAG: RluA family pseudouridine synthase [Chloroflexota bacterium]|nr:RluA family pseudouridine synthase [Chloroflexota bacterium]